MHDNYAKRMNEILEGIHIALKALAPEQPDPDWPKAHHFECGYYDPDTSNAYKFICLRTGKQLPTEHEKACPAFCRRPKDGDDSE